MVDVSQLLGATSSDASSFSEEIFNYEKRIAEITPPGKQEDLLASHQRFTVARIKDFASLVCFFFYSNALITTEYGHGVIPHNISSLIFTDKIISISCLVF